MKTHALPDRTFRIDKHHRGNMLTLRWRSGEDRYVLAFDTLYREFYANHDITVVCRFLKQEGFWPYRKADQRWAP